MPPRASSVSITRLRVSCAYAESGAFELSRGQWGVGWRWCGGGCLHLLPAEEETGQREDRWDKGEVKEGEARMVHIRWQGNLQQEMTCPRNRSFLLRRRGVGGWGGVAASSLHWVPDWLHHLFVQAAEQTSTDKHRLALAASRHLVLIWGYGALVVCAWLPLFFLQHRLFTVCATANDNVNARLACSISSFPTKHSHGCI